MSVQLPSSVKDRELEIRPFIEEHAARFGIDPNLVRALITQESRFVAEATSPTGAFGYGQFTGIGARQVQNIGRMSDCPDPDGLSNFEKSDADVPDLGVKAVCATLWWLFNKKYPSVSDKKVQLEAVLTFYNSGGKAAALVIQHGGHDKAVDAIRSLPSRYRSQAAKYAPEVALWYVAWHEHLKARPPEPKPESQTENPFEGISKDWEVSPAHRAVVEALRAFDALDADVNLMINSREGLTEVTLIIPGEFLPNVRN